MYVVLVLPFPPSVNNLFSGTRRRFISKGYKAWKEEAHLALLKQRPLPHIGGKVTCRYSFGRPDKRRRDLGNLEKAISDCLVEHAVIEDDSLIEEMTLRWSDDVHGAQIELETFDA
jgi:crossover junction endodeoxyribonuclease RusA